MKRVAAFCLLLLVTIVASVRAQGAAVKMDGYPGPGTAPTVKLRSPGDAPRTALRFAVPASHTEHVDIAMQMSMAMETAGDAIPPISVPTMTIGSDAAVTGIAANGDVSYTMVFNDVTLGSDGDQNVRAVMQGALGSLKGLKADATVSNRGIIRSVKIDVSKLQAPPLVAQMMDSLSNQMQSLSAPLPEEEVGVGARWEVRQATVVGSITTFQRAEYQLTALDGKSATVTVKMEQNAPAQSVSNPALPAGADVHLKGMSGSGSATMTIHLDGLVATGTVSVDSTSTMDMFIGGNTQTLATRSSMKMTTTSQPVAGVKRP